MFVCFCVCGYLNGVEKKDTNRETDGETEMDAQTQTDRLVRMIQFLIHVYHFCKVLSNVSNKSWWRKTLKSLKPMHPIRYVSQTDDLNEDFSHQGVHPFYGSVIDNCYINRVSIAKVQIMRNV